MEIKPKVRKFLKWFFILYIIPTAFYGMYISFNEFYFFSIHDSTPVKFDNDFIFASTDPNNRSGNYNGIFHPDGTIAIKKNVVSVEAQNEFVYGYRKESIYEPYFKQVGLYFICQVKEDCSKTQNYKKSAFQKALQEKGLPPYQYNYFNDLKKLQVKEWIMVHWFGKDALSTSFLTRPKESIDE